VALFEILRGLGIGTEDEVLIQVPTHIVVANAISYVGAKPVFVDCRRDSYNIDLDQAEKHITPRTKAILLQHTFGIPVDMDAALDLARRYDLLVIEDCVHALGTTFDGKHVGSFGHAAFFSTEETKTISSTMGGMAVTEDPKLADKLHQVQSNCDWPSRSLTARYLLKLVVYHIFGHPYLHPYTRPIYMFLRRNPRTHLSPGATAQTEQSGERPPNYEQRLSNAQAAVALRQLERLDENLTHRNWVANVYRGKLSEYGFDVPHPPAKAKTAYVRYPVWVKDRENTMQAAAPFVELGQWFNSVLEESASPDKGHYPDGSCPTAEEAAEHLVNLPTYLRVTPRDIDAMITSLVMVSTESGR
jgi:dTDP-4-amino-4,6-dideoxygalactose transaminase